MATAENMNGNEETPAGCTTYTLRKGSYIAMYIANYARDISQIEKAFKTLLDDPRIDPAGCCAEFYFPEGIGFAAASDIHCMVRLAD